MKNREHIDKTNLYIIRLILHTNNTKERSTRNDPSIADCEIPNVISMNVSDRTLHIVYTANILSKLKCILATLRGVITLIDSESASAGHNELHVHVTRATAVQAEAQRSLLSPSVTISRLNR